jgi:hypothetical protein
VAEIELGCVLGDRGERYNRGEGEGKEEENEKETPWERREFLSKCGLGYWIGHFIVLRIGRDVDVYGCASSSGSERAGGTMLLFAL